MDPDLATHTADELRALLDSEQNTAESLIELSHEMPETILPFPFPNEDQPLEEMRAYPAARVRSCIGFLHADAVRFHEAGNDAEAFRRLGAAARILLVFSRQEDELLRLMGSGGRTIYTLEPLVQARAIEGAAPEDIEALRQLVGATRATADPMTSRLDEALNTIESALEGR